MVFIRLLLISLLALLLISCAQPNINKYVDADTAAEQSEVDKESPADIYVQLGIAYMRDGQYVTALKKLRRGLELDSNNANIHNVTALVYEQLNDDEKALSYFDSAVTLSPKDPYIRNARATHYCKHKRYAEADADFNAALNNPLYRTPWVALTNAGLCSLRQDDAVKAESYFRRALSHNKQYFIALEEMAKIGWQQKNYLSARAYLERFLTVQKPSAGLLWLAIKIENALSNGKAMERYKQQLLDQFPDALEIQLMREMGSRI
jgi:type IV pilus assembly protein PilF